MRKTHNFIKKMDNNTPAAEMFRLYQLLGEEAFSALMELSDLSEARMREMTEQILNLAPTTPAQTQTIREAVAQRGRQGAKNDLLNMGLVDEDIELAFRAAGL